MTHHQGMLTKGLRPGLWLAALGLPAILLVYGGLAASRDGGAASLTRAMTAAVNVNDLTFGVEPLPPGGFCAGCRAALP
jgi:hypothetical protein